MLDNLPPVPVLLAQILVLFFGIGIHEYAHCKFADLAGDPTPRYYGRVTLNLFKHFEPAGTIMMVLTSLAGYGIGWGRAAPMDSHKMRNPRWDLFTAVLAGPASNFVQAVVFALAFRLTLATGTLAGVDGPFGEFLRAFVLFGILINLGLMMFNLIPFGPLDGHWLVGLLMPEPMRLQWFRVNQQIGTFGLFIAVILLQRSGVSLTAGPVSALFRFLTGVPI